jgi:DNA-binding CsgD family transcriptional regulator
MHRPLDNRELRLPFEGLLVALWGRHDLYVQSLAALLSDRGASVRVLADPFEAASRRGDLGARVLLLESPLPFELRRAAEIWPRVLVLAERANAGDLLEGGLPEGITVLRKNAPLAELALAIRRPGADAPRSEAESELTPRQRQVLELIAAGLDNAQIAERLGISTRTARAHVSAVLERLGVENRTQAAVVAVRRGWAGTGA